VRSINRLGGTGIITRVYHDENNQLKIDVKYTVNGGYDTNLDPVLLQPYEDLDRGARQRRARQILDLAPEQAPSPPQGSGNKMLSKNNKVANNKENVGPRRVTQKKNMAPPAQLMQKVRKRRNSVNPDQPRKVPSTDDKPSIGIPKLLHCDNPEDDVSTLADESAEFLSKKSTFRHPHAVVRSLFRSSSPVNRQPVDISPLSPIESLPSSIELSEVDVAMQEEPQPPSLHQEGTEATPPKPSTVDLLLDQSAKEAADFCNSIVRKQDDCDDMDDESIEVEPPIATQRQNAFNTILFRLLFDNDDELDTETLLPAVNSKAEGQPYTQVEMCDYLKQLRAQNKIQDTGGMIYAI
jgi:hypothetical protein